MPLRRGLGGSGIAGIGRGEWYLGVASAFERLRVRVCLFCSLEAKQRGCGEWWVGSKVYGEVPTCMARHLRIVDGEIYSCMRVSSEAFLYILGMTLEFWEVLLYVVQLNGGNGFPIFARRRNRILA